VPYSFKFFNFIILLVFSVNAFTQTISEINSEFKIPDTLTYDTELRIYKTKRGSDCFDLFRMFKDQDGFWIAELYERCNEEEKLTGIMAKHPNLVSKSNMEYVFKNFLRSHLMNMPSLNTFKWKLVNRGEIRLVKKEYDGNIIDTFELNNKSLALIDVISYQVQVQHERKINKFTFSNPDGYLKLYPEIDELIYQKEILDTIKEEFGVW
jgi:hypothetical protein